MIETSEQSDASDSDQESSGERTGKRKKKKIIDSGSSKEEGLKEDDSVESSSQHSDAEEIEALGLDRKFIMKELGCTTKKVIKNEELLDQFIVLKAILDKNLPKLVFKDMQILQHIVSDVFPSIAMT